MNGKITLNYPLFDGLRVWEKASVVIENGVISPETVLGSGEVDDRFFLMPGLIDAHTHLGTMEQVQSMLQHGITTTCDVAASSALVAASGQLYIHASAGMAMGVVLSGKGYAEKAVKNGAKYIKVLLFNPLSVGKSALCSIVDAAHEKDLKVAVHATELSTVRQAVEAGADILLHVPQKEVFPRELAQEMAEKGIASAPTLVMMKAFSLSGQFGYKPTDYANGEAAVALLHDCGVQILAATDANPGTYTPRVDYGVSLHQEMELLVKAGLSPLEVLQSATHKSAETFCLKGTGAVAIGKQANLLLVKGRPDKTISESRNIVQVYANGQPLL